MFLPIKFVKLCFPSHQKSAYIPPHRLAQMGGNLVPTPTKIFKRKTLLLKKKKRGEREKKREEKKKTRIKRFYLVRLIRGNCKKGRSNRSC